MTRRPRVQIPPHGEEGPWDADGPESVLVLGIVEVGIQLASSHGAEHVDHQRSAYALPATE